VPVNHLDAATAAAAVKAVSIAAGTTTVGAGIKELERIVGLKHNFKDTLHKK